MQVNPVEGETDQPSSDNVTDQGSDDVLPDVNSNARSATQLHSERNQEHVRNNVFKLTDDKRRKDEIHSKHLSKQIRRHLSDEHGEADHDVASDST